MFLYILSLAFSVWMFVDAYRRGVEWWWLLLIFLFQPLGGIAYFIIHKLPELRLPSRAEAPSLGAAEPRSEPLPLLRRRAELTPSVANLSALGAALEKQGEYAEAIEVFRDVLRRDPRDRAALHGLAGSAASLGRLDEAIEHYERLMEEDPRYRDFSAALELGEALWAHGQKQRALELLADLASSSRRINHQLAYAHYLAQDGDAARAREVLEQGLSDYESSPDYVRRRDRAWAKRARQRLADLGR